MTSEMVSDSETGLLTAVPGQRRPTAHWAQCGRTMRRQLVGLRFPPVGKFPSATEGLTCHYDLKQLLSWLIMVSAPQK